MDLLRILKQLWEAVQILYPVILQLIELFKGQPKDVKIEAANRALSAAKEHCSGAACHNTLKI